MDNWMQNLQSILSMAQGGNAQNAAARSASSQRSTATDLLGGLLTPDNLTKILGPSALGGLAGALMGGSKGGSGKKALLLGGTVLGMLALDSYKKQVEAANRTQSGGLGFAAAPPQTAANPPAQNEGMQITRLLRAMVFATRADGHMDDKERAAIGQKLNELSMGPEAERIVTEAMQIPVDPNLVANGVSDADEALELYLVSRSVIDVDQFMERNYLSALANALRIPENVQQAIEADIAKAAR